MKNQTKNLLLITLLLTLPLSAHSENACLNFIKKIFFDEPVQEKIDLNAHMDHRSFIKSYAKNNEIPVFLKQNRNGEDIPYILVNKKSAPKLKSFIENSYGTEVKLQPQAGNDHGSMRIGNYLIDVDTPGSRNFGEINKTGLAWKNFDSYTARRDYASGTILEVAYLITPEEKRTIEIYQRVRRAAIFRVKFAFKNARTPDHPFLLEDGSEHCFTFCKADALMTHLHEIENKLRDQGLKNVPEFMNKAEVVNGLTVIKETILNTKADNLTPDILQEQAIVNAFHGLYPAEIKTAEQKHEFLRWVVSYDSSKEYNKVLENLGVTSNTGVEDARNKRATAVLVYDEGANPVRFNNAEYTAQGAFTNWPTSVQKPVE